MDKPAEDYCSGSYNHVCIDKRKHIRCDVCNRRLLASEMWDTLDNVLIGYRIPRHKPKIKKKKKTAKRKNKFISVRGK